MSFIGSLAEMPSKYANITADRNLDKAKFVYQMQQDQLQQEREDTALQRQAADAAAVGINPLSLNGNGAQSSSGSAGMVSSTPHDYSLGLAQSLSSTINDINSIVSTQSQNAVNGAQVDLLNAQKASVVADTKYRELENEVFKQRFAEEMASSRANRKNIDVQREYQQFMNDQAKEWFNSDTKRNYFMSDGEKALTFFKQEFPDADSAGVPTDAEYKKMKASLLGAKSDESITGLIKSLLTDVSNKDSNSATGRVIRGLSALINPDGVKSDSDMYARAMERNAQRVRNSRR